MMSWLRFGFLMGVCLHLLGVDAGTGFSRAQDPEVANKLLELAAQAEPKEALKHLTTVTNTLRANKTLTRAERESLTNRFVRILQAKARLPEDLAVVFGPMASKQVARQVFYRRYLEQWVVTSPVGLCVTFDCAKGQDPVIRTIQPLEGP